REPRLAAVVQRREDRGLAWLEQILRKSCANLENQPPILERFLSGDRVSSVMSCLARRLLRRHESTDNEDGGNPCLLDRTAENPPLSASIRRTRAWRASSASSRRS